MLVPVDQNLRLTLLNKKMGIAAPFKRELSPSAGRDREDIVWWNKLMTAKEDFRISFYSKEELSIG